MWFTAKISGVLEMQKIHLSYNILLPLQADSLLPLPLPQSLYGQCSVVCWCHNKIFSDG